MLVAKFKRILSGLEYVDNAYELQKDAQGPIDRFSCMQADSIYIW